MHNIGFKAVQMGNIRRWCVFMTIVYIILFMFILKLYLKAILWYSLIKIERLRGSNKKLYDIKCIISALLAETT